MSKTEPTNQQIAGVLDRIAELLELQDDNPFRIQAYRTGANSIRATDESVADLVHKGGAEELDKLPSIGSGLARLIDDYVTTGRSSLLDELESDAAPEGVFTRLPGIGPELARRIVKELDIETLEELEQAAHAGRLDRVEGFGPSRVEAIRTSLAGLLSRSASRRSSARTDDDGNREPSVELLLQIDAEYRRRAESGDLKKIAPKRFNPKNEAWLPVLNKQRDGWSFTVLYSNTARAHELEKTDDWVVIYFQRDGKEGQRTVVTATSGPLEGQRVVRGREKETREYYDAAPSQRVRERA